MELLLRCGRSGTASRSPIITLSFWRPAAPHDGRDRKQGPRQRHEDEVRCLVDQTVARFGRLDVAVNNAGTEGQPGPITEQSADSYAATFETNVLGMLLSLKHELRVMLAQGHGSIVNLSSVAGKKGSPGASVYVASKHAVEGLTKSAALEAAASGVRVNAVAPGPVE